MFAHRPICRRSLAWWAIVVALGFASGEAHGQQGVGGPGSGIPAAGAAATTDAAGPEQPAAGAEAGAAREHKSLFEILRGGGLVMIPLVSCSFLMLVFVFERLISLRRGRVIPGPFVKRLLPQLREGKLDRDAALALCQESKSPVGDVLAAGVKKWGRPAVEVEQALIDALGQELVEAISAEALQEGRARNRRAAA